jgi:hypothetical protein
MILCCASATYVGLREGIEVVAEFWNGDGPVELLLDAFAEGLRGGGLAMNQEEALGRRLKS